MDRPTTDLSKSDVIRNYLARNPRSTGAEIVKAIKHETGLNVSAGLVSQVKHQAAKVDRPSAAPGQTSGQKRTTGRRSPKLETIGSTLTLESLMAAKKLANQLGGIEAAKTAVDALAKLA